MALAATDDLLERVRRDAGGDDPALSSLTRHDDIEIRGMDAEMFVWTLS